MKEIKNKQKPKSQNLPKGWREVRLGGWLEFKYGFGLPEKERVKGKILVYGSSGIVGWHNKAKVNGSGIIIGRKGNVGAVYFSEKPFYPIDTVYFVDSLKRKGDLKFFYYLLKTIDFKKVDINVGVPGLNRDTAHSLKVFIPEDTNEQKRIASVLSAFDEKIELNNKINQILEEIAQAIFKEWFVKFRFPGWQKVKSVDSELGKIPEGWRVGYLGELMKLRKEKFKKYDECKNLKLLDLGRFPQKSLAITSYGKGEEIKTSATKFYKEDILFGAVRPYFHKVVIAPFDGVTNQSVFVIVPQKPEYYSFLITILFSESTINYATTVASGTKMPVVKWKDLCNMKILFPKIELLKIFEQKIRLFYEIILNNVKENQKLSALRDLLLPKLMSGEVRV